MTETNTRPDKKADQILDAADELFMQYGFDAATTDMIQKQAGVSKATLYGRFPNKESLFSAVIERSCKNLADTIRHIHSGKGTLEQKLRAIGEAYLGEVLSSRGRSLYRTAVANAPRFPALAHLFYQAGPMTLSSLLVELLSTAVEEGKIDVSITGLDGAASLFHGLLRGDIQIEFLTHPDATPSQAQIEAYVNRAVQIFLKALS